MRTTSRLISFSLLSLLIATPAWCQSASASQPPPAAEPAKDLTKETEKGIPVTDHLTVEKCGGCHKADADSNLSRISWIRTTPEGWQEAIKRMVELNGLQLGPNDAHAIVRYLANDHGLAPDEAAPVRWYLENTQPQTEPIPNPTVRHACASCHAFARPQIWRRSAAEWHLLKNMHIGYFPLSQFVAFHAPPGEEAAAAGSPADHREPGDVAIDYLKDNYGLYSAAWSNWRAQMTDPDLAGRWLVTASAPGKGKYFGEMTISQVSPGEFNTECTMVSARDGSKLTMPGKSFVYTGFEWRGAAKAQPWGTIREVMTVSPDRTALQGRWFWGSYEEFGFAVSAQRESRDLTVLGADVDSLQAGASNAPVKIYGAHFPADLKAADIKLGPGVTVDKVDSIAPGLLTVRAKVDEKLVAGKRSITVKGRTAPDAFGVFGTIDYIKVNADTALAHTGGTVAKKGFVQYEAHAFSNGLDGKANTPDDVDLGPIQAKWSIEEFIAHNNDNDKEFVGYIDSNGLFTPSGDGPNPQRRFSADNIGDVWVVAKYAGKSASAPLEAKSYLVVAIPDFLRFETPEIEGSK